MHIQPRVDTKRFSFSKIYDLAKLKQKCLMNYSIICTVVISETLILANTTLDIDSAHAIHCIMLN